MVKSKKYHRQKSKEWRKLDKEISEKYHALGFNNSEPFSSFKKRYKKHKN